MGRPAFAEDAQAITGKFGQVAGMRAPPLYTFDEYFYELFVVSYFGLLM